MTEWTPPKEGDPTRLVVMKRLSEALEQITPANGYACDFAGRVYRGRVMFGRETEMPFISILEVPIPLDQMPVPVDSEDNAGEWEIVIQGFCEDDKENPTDPAHIMLADVKKRLVEEKKKTARAYDAFGIGDVVTGIKIGPGTVRPPDEVSANAYFWLTLTLTIVESLKDPFWLGNDS